MPLLLFLALATLAGPTAAPVDRDLEPLPLVIKQVVPVFANVGGPQFAVTLVNKGSQPLPFATIDRLVFVEVDGVRYGSSHDGTLYHAVPANIGPGQDFSLNVSVVGRNAPIKAGLNRVVIIVGGVRSEPIVFHWAGVAARPGRRGVSAARRTDR